MPVLNWVGKKSVVNHHKDVPFKFLKRKDSKSMGNSENLLIEGDNLEALKSLMPYYKGQIKCIYIDPPYNTGEENWIYNDNVNSLKIQKWLGKVVGGEGKDLSRHDKWLCMMYPRLKLLRELLSDDGVIFISIGHDELSNLIAICDEIFYSENNIGIISRLMKSGSNKGTFLSPNIDYILVYAKDIDQTKKFRVQLEAEYIKKQYNKIQKTGIRKGEKYREFGLYQASLEKRKNQRYWIKCPDGGFVIPDGETFPTKLKNGSKIIPNDGDGVWRWSSDRYIEELKNDNVIFKKTNKSSLINEKHLKANWNIYTKIWLKDRIKEGRVPTDHITKFENRHSAAELKKLNISFEYSKPSKLVSYLISFMDGNDFTVMDSFAGSGTTGQAVLQLNKEDKGNRKFILIEMEPKISKNITSKRLSTVLNHSGGGGGVRAENTGFVYCTLGNELFDKNGIIDTNCTFNHLANYIFFTETKQPLEKSNVSGIFLGKSKDAEIYLIFHGVGKKNILDYAILKSLSKNTKKIIYADSCTIAQTRLEQYHVTFKQIPYEVKVF